MNNIYRKEWIGLKISIDNSISSIENVNYALKTGVFDMKSIFDYILPQERLSLKPDFIKLQKLIYEKECHARLLKKSLENTYEDLSVLEKKSKKV